MLALIIMNAITKIDLVKAEDTENNKIMEYFPPISDCFQVDIFNTFDDVITSEKRKLVHFHDSLIDINVLKKFNENISGPQTHEVFAIDLGGSSLKITTVRITYSGEKNQSPHFEALNRMTFTYESDPELKEGSQIKWYEWTVEKILHYLEVTGMSNCLNTIHTAAFTFSYTLKQYALDSATVVGCNKTFYFSKENFMGSNVIKDLNDELKRRKVNIVINCILNDVVATYAAGVAEARENPIALIVGTGTNAGFSLETSTGLKIINSEMAQFNLNKDCLDKATLEILNTSTDKFYPLEVTVAGLKFVEKVKIAVKALLDQEENPNPNFNVNLIDHDFIDFCLKYDDQKAVIPFLDGSKRVSSAGLEKLIGDVVYAIKVRAYRILTPIIISASSVKSFTLIVNGSVICNDFDISILKSELISFLKIMGYDTSTKFEIIKNNDASLFGSAYVSLVYSLNNESRNLN